MTNFGIVVDNNDPQHYCRLKVRINGLHTQKDDEGKYIIDDDSLPWSWPLDVRNGIPKLGDTVSIYVERDYTYFWLGVIYNDGLMAKFNDKKTDYVNIHPLIWDDELGNDTDDDYKKSNNREDEHIRVYSSDSEGIVIELKSKQGTNKINVTNTNDITLENANGDKISLTFSDKEILLKANNKIKIDSSTVEIGQGGLVGVITERFKQLFDMHTHTCPPMGGMSTAPVMGINDTMITHDVKVSSN